jgi:hypothetical protein
VPHSLPIPLPELFALLAAIAFAAGLNVYATVAALGLLARFGHIPLPPGLQLHTFVRVPIAALLAYGATAQLSPAEHILAAFLGAAIAFTAHGGKTALRAAVTPSPEPFSNISLSLAEDVLAVALTWLATQHPYTAATITLVLIIVIILLARIVIHALRSLFLGAENELAGRPANVANK